MANWNNGYAYNGQYQDPNGWNNDQSNQYPNQNPHYYPNGYDNNSQYVNFNQFISQMNIGDTTGNRGYNEPQYPSSHYQSRMPSTSQSNYDGSGTPQHDHNHQPLNPEPSSSHSSNDVLAKSKLTPTATEFVPKSTAAPSSSTQNVKSSESSTNSYNNKFNSRGSRSSSDKNWRDRPSSTPQVHEPHQSKDNSRKHESNTNRDSYKSTEGSSRSQNYENGYRNENRNDLPRKNGRNKNKETERTFYNSSGPKESRNGKGEGGNRGRNWGGTQRVRDHITYEDEYYANNYVSDKQSYKEEKVERTREAKVQSASPFKSKSKHINAKELTQRERLSEQLEKGTLECLVCCERVKQTEQVWSCGNCYHVLHLRCIRKWANSSVQEGKWRCPACQNTSSEVPTEYRCMCGAVGNPEWSRGGSVPHTCGRACRRPRVCPHPCTLLCHPGPCPPCQATVTKQCGCGAESRSVLCSSKLAQLCGRVCRRLLNCNVHHCAKECHEGTCDDCAEIKTQICHCPAAKSRSVTCTPETSTESSWTCGDSCGRVLSCGSHVCRDECHAPPCHPCALAPNVVITCPCGKNKLPEGSRKLCSDPIPLCGNICAKPLPCGPDGDRHFCKLECHEGPCPVCTEKTVLQCRCGGTNQEIPCAELPQMINNVFCKKKCNKKLSCGRHRCREVCCALDSHRCPAVCGRTLSCQTHRCEQLCHNGHCPPCPRLSFEELACPCGLTVMLPPIRCGARPPVCPAPCAIARPCEHPAHHSCHTGECPPCVVLTSKRCHGGHEERKTIPCSQAEFSCGLPCGKPLPCGKHTCIKTCHKGPCDAGKCSQPCTEKRPSCGHECGAACHSAQTRDPCPSATPCTHSVRAQCPCGRKHAQRACADNARDRARIISALAASKMQEGGTVDIGEMSRPSNNLKTLECDDECRVEARTRQMALALQIRNPDVSAKLAPRYSEYCRTTAARDPAFAETVHRRLTDLVRLAKKSKQKTRSYSFPSMNRQKRQFIHEMCEHFGCESVAYDAEPNRNVVATADKERSWLPAMSLQEVLSREAGKRRVPGPVLRPAASMPATSTPAAQPASAKSSGSGWATLKPTNPWASRSQPPKTQEPKIDYFDNPPE